MEKAKEINISQLGINSFPERYTLKKPLGTALFGTVYSAWDNKANKSVSIKRMKLTELYYLKICLREMIVMRLLNQGNILPLLDVICIESHDIRLQNTIPKIDVFLVTEKMDFSLKQFIEGYQVITKQIIAVIVIQILYGLNYMNSAKIIHRDLTPKSIFINDNCVLKLGHFGLSRVLASDYQKMTENITDINYRAPDNFWNDSYNEKMDVWSVGCILFEIITKKTLFNVKNHNDLLFYIVNTFGSPSSEDCNFFLNKDVRNYVMNLKYVAPKPVSQVVKDAVSQKGIFIFDDECIDLLSKMLVFNPKKRISIKDAIQHPFLKDFNDLDRDIYEGNDNLCLEFDEKIKEIDDKKLIELIIEESKKHETGVFTK